jgi:hypothetical protein
MDCGKSIFVAVWARKYDIGHKQYAFAVKELTK